MSNSVRLALAVLLIVSGYFVLGLVIFVGDAAEGGAGILRAYVSAILVVSAFIGTTGAIWLVKSLGFDGVRFAKRKMVILGGILTVFCIGVLLADFGRYIIMSGAMLTLLPLALYLGLGLLCLGVGRTKAS